MSPTISDAGRQPDDEKGKRNRHLLAIGCEAENLIPMLRGGDGAIPFFRQRSIHWWKSSRSGDDCSRDTPTRNLASSQVACVNFLLPLAAVEGATGALLRVVAPDVQAVEMLAYNGLTSAVEFEWVGRDSCLEGGAGTRGANVTSADALIVATTPTGRCAFLIEWKCCEEYKAGEFMGEGSSGATRRHRYETLYGRPDSSFNGLVPMEELFYEPFYQLMRLHLLGDKMLREREFEISEFRVIVVCPDENVAYRNTIASPQLAARFDEAKTTCEAMRGSLRTPAGFAVVSQAALLAALRASSCSASLAEWAEYHRLRYGW